MPAHPTFYVRRRIYQKYGGFDTGLKLQSDFEMALRLLEVYKIQTHYLPKIIVKMRMGGMSNRSLRNIIHGNKEAIIACRMHGFDAGLRFLTQKICSKIPQFFMKASV
jgi:hypothetical protein